MKLSVMNRDSRNLALKYCFRKFRNVESNTKYLLNFAKFLTLAAADGVPTAIKPYFVSRICFKDSPYKFSAKSDNSEYGLSQLYVKPYPPQYKNF